MNAGRGGAGADAEQLAEARRTMVVDQLVHRGIRDPRVLGAMGSVPRHLFVDADLESVAYEDRPLPIGHGQTISQPYMVARATELVSPQPTERALEVGAGCGYQAAVLAQLCAEVFAVEIIPALAARARRTLTEIEAANVTVDCFDASGGWPAHAPYDVIIVSAGAPRVPAMLAEQLADGGRLAIPVGTNDDQVLALIRRSGDEFTTSYDTRCRYVDLLGRFGVGGGAPAA